MSAFSPHILNALATQERTVLARQPNYEDVREFVPIQTSPGGGASTGFILARVLRWKAFPGNANRWLYEWEQVAIRCAGTFPDDLIVEAVEGGLFGTFDTLDPPLVNSGPALNLKELTNLGSAGPMGHGVNTAGESYPETMHVQPIGGGRTTASQSLGTCANGTLIRLSSGLVVLPEPAAPVAVWYMDVVNADDGSCS